MKIKFFTLSIVSALLLTTSCGNTGKGGDGDKADQALADSIEQQEAEAKPDGDAYIDYDRILYQIVNGDTMEVNTYDEKGRLTVHRYQREGEEGGDMYWCKDINTYDDNDNLIKTYSLQGEWDCTTTYEYDNKGRLILEKGPYGSDVHYTWKGLTRYDDAFCRSEITYSDETYKQKIDEKSYVSNNGPIAWENIYGKDGKLLEYRSFTDEKLTSAIRHEFKDNVETETWIRYNEDGTEKNREVRSKTDYLPNGKYNKILRTHIFEDGKEEIGYENEYDSENRLIKNGSVEISYDGTIVTSVDKEYDTTIVTKYMRAH